ncbi:MAG: Glu/Leu/Phe/Val dehydrogenase [Myxococcota bacterium]
MELESLHILHETGLTMLIAIDSTARGPALGGCRWRSYPDEEAARRDAADLARAMTRKAALADLSLGGGKAVVIGDPGDRTRDQLLAFGSFVDSLEGRYITAADMGTGEEEMAVIAERTLHVSGLPQRLGGPGGPGPFTAIGVHLAMQAALAQLGLSLEGARVAVQGVGNVGFGLIQRLLGSGASVCASDTRPKALEALPEEVELVDPAAIVTRECDVFSPCGPPGVIDAQNMAALRCRIICGAANNPLASPELAAELARCGILYVPDFLANAGGLIHLAVALEGGDEAASQARLRVIPENLERVMERARRSRVTPAEAAEELAGRAALEQA